MAAIERALGAKQHDYEELVLLSTDATHARELTLQELDKARASYEDDKRHRDKELREKQQYVKIRMEMNHRLDRRERHKNELVQKESGDLNDDEERVLKNALAMTALGIETRFGQLRKAGPRVLALGFILFLLLTFGGYAIVRLAT